MSQTEILNTIKASKGISNMQLVGLFPKGHTLFWMITLKSRSIGIIPKGQNETVEEIEIEELSINKIRTLFTPNEDDPLFFDGYLDDPILLYQNFH